MSDLVSSKKNHDIEVLRTIAILFVLLAHAAILFSPSSLYWDVLNYAKFGSGVDLFFCVSGYIVTLSIINKIPNHKSFYSFWEFSYFFWRRRFWRLMPSAVFWVLIVIFMSLVWGGQGVVIPFELTITSAFHAITQTQNFYFITCRPQGSCGELGIYWSLSLENQFYILLPVIAFVFEREKLFLFFFFVFLSQFFLPRTLNEATPFMWSLRTDAIAIGVMIAILSNGRDRSEIFSKIFSCKLISFAALIVLVFSLALLSSPKPFVSFSVGLTAVVSGILVFIASYNGGVFSGNILFRSVCDYIGSRSYSIYLTHVVGLSLTRIILGFDLNVIGAFETILNLLFFLAITFVMAELSYRFIEMPLRKRGRI